VLFIADIPAQVPPLTPGTNKKMTEALKASFSSWGKETSKHNIPKGKNDESKFIGICVLACVGTFNFISLCVILCFNCMSLLDPRKKVG